MKTELVVSATSSMTSADSSYVAQQITRTESAVQKDPWLAIGTAKELVETCCRTILSARGVTLDKAVDLGQLVKRTSKELQLTPEFSITHSVYPRIR